MAPRPAHALLLLGATADLFCTIMKNNENTGELPPLTKTPSADTVPKVKVSASECPQRRKSVFADFSFKSRGDSHHKVSRSGSQTKRKISPSDIVPQNKISNNESNIQQRKISLSEISPLKGTSPNGSPTLYQSSQNESQAFVKVSTRRPSKIQMSSREPSIQLTNSPTEPSSSPFVLKSLPSKTNSSHQKVFPSEQSPTSNLMKTNSSETPPLSPPLKIYSDFPPFQSSSVVSLPTQHHVDINLKNSSQDENNFKTSIKKSISGSSQIQTDFYRYSQPSRYSQSSLSKTPSIENPTNLSSSRSKLAQDTIHHGVASRSKICPNQPPSMPKLPMPLPEKSISGNNTVMKKDTSTHLIRSISKDTSPTVVRKKSPCESMPSSKIMKTLPTKPPPSQLIESLSNSPSPSSSHLKDFASNPPFPHTSVKDSKTIKSENQRKLL